MKMKILFKLNYVVLLLLLSYLGIKKLIKIIGYKNNQGFEVGEFGYPEPYLIIFMKIILCLIATGLLLTYDKYKISFLSIKILSVLIAVIIIFYEYVRVNTLNSNVSIFNVILVVSLTLMFLHLKSIDGTKPCSFKSSKRPDGAGS